MALFLIERNVKDSAEQVAHQSQQLADAETQWLRTYVTSTKIYSLYDAPTVEHLRRLAHHHRYTIHRIVNVQNEKHVPT